MVTFSEQLNTWKNAKHIDVKSLASRSGLTEWRVRGLLAGTETPTQKDIENISMVFQVPVMTFVQGVELNTSEEKAVVDVKAEEVKLVEETATINNVEEDVINEFSILPSDYKREISKLFVNWLSDITKMNLSDMDRATKMSTCTFTKYKNKTTPISERAMRALSSYLEEKDIMDKFTFYHKLSGMSKHYVANYNLTVAKKKYGFASEKISLAIGLNKASISTALAYKFAISGDTAVKVATLFHIEPKVFQTQFLTEYDFYDIKEIDAEKYLPSTTPKKKKTEKKEDVELSDYAKRLKEAAELPAMRTEKSSRQDAFWDVIQKAPANIVQGSISQNEKVLKMYGKLTETHRKEVLDLIEKYFWEDL